MNMPPWSFSSLTSFETCGKRYYHLKVAKDVVDIPHESATWGSTVHKHLEDRARDGTPLPQPLQSYEKLVAPLLNVNGTLLVEQQLAVDESLRPVDWESKAAWCRGIVDIGVLTGKRAILLDWKTGKRKPESDQLRLFAGLAFAHYPDVEVSLTGFVWLREGIVDRQKLRRSEAPVIWQQFLPRVQRLRRAYEEERFPPKPSGLCRKWCPVPHSLCEFSGRK